MAKTHFKDPDHEGSSCGRAAADATITSDRDAVDCQRCIKSINARGRASLPAPPMQRAAALSPREDQAELRRFHLDAIAYHVKEVWKLNPG